MPERIVWALKKEAQGSRISSRPGTASAKQGTVQNKNDYILSASKSRTKHGVVKSAQNKRQPTATATDDGNALVIEPCTESPKAE
jgi:hypothetical protein